MELLRMLIVDINPWFAAVLIGLGASVAVIVVVFLSVKPNKLSHVQAMAKLETEHRERMLKINRELPKLVDGTKATVVENGE